MRIKTQDIAVVILGLIIGGIIVFFCHDAEKANLDISEEFNEPVADTMKYDLPTVPYLEMGYGDLKE